MTIRTLLVPLAASLLAATPAGAQDALQGIPGKLINNPATLDWSGNGKDYQKRGITGADIPGGGAAAHYVITRRGTHPYDVTADIAVTQDIAKGDDVTIGFWARTVSAETPDHEGTIGLRVQQNSAPWPGFIDKTLAIGPAWKWYEVTGAATLALPKGTAIVSLQLAGARQTIDIGQMIVIKGAKAIAPTAPNAATAAVELPPQLAGKGRLLNHPDSRAWGFAGPDASHADQPDKTIYLGKSTRFTSPGVGAHPWDISTQIPIDDAITESDQLLIAFAARTVSAATDDGKATIGVRIQNNTPPDYPGFANTTIKAGSNWQLIQFRVSGPDAVPAGKAVLALHFAGAQQVVDIGPVYILKTN